MSDTSPHNPEGDETVANAAPGEWLREKRESLGWPLEQVGQELRILPSVLRALEENRFEVLEAPIFVRGHLRNYARLLGLSAEEVLEAYEASRPSETDPSLKVSGASGPAMENRTPAWVVPFAWLVLLTMLVLGVLYWYVGPTRESSMADSGDVGDTSMQESREASGTETTSSPEGREPNAEGSGNVSATDDEPMMASPLDSLEVDGTPAIEGAPESEESGESGVSPGATTTGSAEEGGSTVNSESVTADRNESGADPNQGEPTAGEADTDETDAPDPGPVPGADTPGVRSLTLRVSEDSWLEIYDDADRQLYYGLAGAGEEVTLRGEAPISLFMGNAPAVTLEVDGESHDFSGRIRRDNTARITVYAAEEDADGDPSGD